MPAQAGIHSVPGADGMGSRLRGNDRGRGESFVQQLRVRRQEVAPDARGEADADDPLLRDLFGALASGGIATAGAR